PPTFFTSFPYHPCVPDAERDVKVPAWLNDVSLYHNRGDTTFTGENSQYGDFFGLDDLFTENPRVVDGFIDIYKTWIHDFRIDGFRMDTMKHVDDAFWQRFAPAIQSYAASQGIPDFYMFGEVAEDFSRPITSHYMVHDAVQGVLDFPSQTPQYNNLSDPIPGDDGAGNNDDIGSDATPMDDNFDSSHPLYRKLAELAALTAANPALRDGAEQVRYSSSSAGIYAFSRI